MKFHDFYGKQPRKDETSNERCHSSPKGHDIMNNFNTWVIQLRNTCHTCQHHGVHSYVCSFMTYN